jgi:hypothetical protein
MRMTRHLFAATILAFAVPALVAPVDAQSRPKNATAQCKDGTYSTAKTKQGACSKHGGVQTWFADEKPATTSAPKGAAKGAANGAPQNATAKCKDGTYSFAKQHSGACSHHGGVAEWYK